MILPRQHLERGRLLEVMHDSQYQPCGVDITLKEVYGFKSEGVIDFDNSERRISEVEPIPFEDERVTLRPGAYKVIFNEYVRIPPDVTAMCLPRSSLLRCGVTLECALWDPGYEGRSEALLLVKNEHGITFKRNAKIGQMVFVRLAEDASKLYEGVYKGENK
jgi:dUTP pyrophosphatase